MARNRNSVKCTLWSQFRKRGRVDNNTPFMLYIKTPQTDSKLLLLPPYSHKTFSIQMGDYFFVEIYNEYHVSIRQKNLVPGAIWTLTEISMEELTTRGLSRETDGSRKSSDCRKGLAGSLR